ncbi:hypothetical protein Ade02nite_45340 [Paractinoplanes deccanensis]|uniref:Glycosyltransferase 2-like domain-containing protein n=1 Tax=Paractinoplanes deccanensis TaxID=113561 RepID=A0ABQ3Y7B6_9ACTN|nr:hypothetical protein Ade02nite_45340 [Actinoplanes deccanensis]
MSVVLPVRDPAGLPLTLRRLPPVDEVVIVAEGRAAAAARSARPGAVVIAPTRPGPGNALATGLAAARGDVVVVLNGDGSTDPAEIPRFVDTLVAGADLALGSRYTPGGRDLTGSRWRRWADLILIWVVNVLLGTRRTDPGFGYTAFWRDTLAHLDLPDPAVRAGASWGEGPEIGPLLAIRPVLRGLRVAEIPCVAFPPIRRARREDRPRLRHWLRAALRERGDRRSYTPPPIVAPAPRVRHIDAGNGPGYRLEQTGPGYRITPEPTRGRHAADPAASGRHGVGPSAAGSRGTGPSAAGTRGTGAAAAGRFGPRAASERTTADVWRQADRRQPGEPIWGPPHRTAAPTRDLWRERRTRAHRSPNQPPAPLPAAHPEPLFGPDVQPRTAEDAWLPLPRAPRQPGEVGARRRRITGGRQSQPDLRVINGEGNDTTGGRRGRLRSVKKP